MIYIGRAGVKLGAFPEEEVRQGLGTGRFFLTDLGWKEGMADWAPLSRFSEFAAPPPPLPPLPGEAPGQDQGPVRTVEAGGLPWDYRQERGLLAAFAETVRLVLTNPWEAFAMMRTEGSLSSPLLYNLIGSWIGLVASGVYAVITSRMQPQPADLTGMRALFYVSPEKAMRYLKMFIVMGPVIVTVSALAGSAIAHLFLMLAGGANKPYHVTLRVFCFSYGSAQLLQMLPVCGGVLAPVWLIVCCITGLTAAHGTTTGRSVAAIVLFLAALFVCCAGMLFLALGTRYQTMGLHP